MRKNLLRWYEKNARDLPWRKMRDPYHIWLSEIMLQQTTVMAVIPYYERFLKLFPTVQTLAQADTDQILKHWAGLGYYARARNMHACAKMIAVEHGGLFPDTVEALKKLPGIGDYTAAAIRAIAFNKPAAVVDGNVERVITRIYAIDVPLPDSKPIIKEHAAAIMLPEEKTPASLAQAFMDLGAIICTPRSPRCGICPLRSLCRAAQNGLAEEYPRKKKKKPVPQKTGFLYVIQDDQGRILLERRPEKGIFGGMPGFPTGEWVLDNGTPPPHPEWLQEAKITPIKGEIRHVFTHFSLRLLLFRALVRDIHIPARFFATDIKKLESQGLPTLFRKALPFIMEICVD